MAALTEGVADGKISFCGYGHDQVCLPGHHYVLQRVPKVGKHDDKDGRGRIHKMVGKKYTKKENVAEGKSQQALMESRFHLWTFQNKYCYKVTKYSKEAGNRC